MGWYLSARLQNFENVQIDFGERIDPTMYLINVRGKNYLGVHGDFDGSASKVQSLQTMAGKPLYAVLSGHLHHNKIDVVQGIKAVRIYEELNRVLSGRVDFNHFINDVAESFRQKMLNDIYTLWSGATANELGGVTYFPAAGSYNEDDLLDLISHVEAAAGGKTATIVGTKKALRQLKESIQSDGAKDELHSLGYYGKFYGTPVVAMPQRHKVGTTNFIYDDNVLTIIAGDDKPIKFVYEGDPIVLMGDPMQNADFTQEYLYGEKYGLGIVLAGGNAGIGRYQTV